MKPKLTFKAITFSDETTLELSEDDIVVFIGPNNAGKSAALHELKRWIENSQSGYVINNAQLNRKGSSEDLRRYLETNAQKSSDNGNLYYGGIGFNIHHSHMHYFDKKIT